MELNRLENWSNLVYFGRVTGTKKDYNIVMGFDLDQKKFYPKMQFYWSQKMTGFNKVPQIHQDDERILERFNDMFTGEHD